MLSAVIRTRRSYPAMLQAEQLVHQRSVHPGPLVLGMSPLNLQRAQWIGDRHLCYFANHILILKGTVALYDFSQSLYVAIQIGLYLIAEAMIWLLPLWRIVSEGSKYYVASFDTLRLGSFDRQDSVSFVILIFLYVLPHPSFGLFEQID